MRLRSRLDANQRDREQMCRSVLALNPHYSDVNPRHPSGGPDGGRDIEAVFDGERIAYGAVGFQNGGNDSDEQKKQIRGKFSRDLKSALTAKSDLKVFPFLTNLNFTMGEQSAMKEEALKPGSSAAIYLIESGFESSSTRRPDSSCGSSTSIFRFRKPSRRASSPNTAIAYRRWSRRASRGLSGP